MPFPKKHVCVQLLAYAVITLATILHALATYAVITLPTYAVISVMSEAKFGHVTEYKRVELQKEG